MINPFGMAAGRLNQFAAGAAMGSVAGGWGGRGMTAAAWGSHGLGSYMGALARGNPTVWGATLGAGWGMASDDTSVLGGAAIGAGIGRYGGAGNRLMWAAARAGRNTPMAGLSYFGRGVMGQGRRDWRFAYAQGRASASYIGSTSRRAWGRIRGLWA